MKKILLSTFYLITASTTVFSSDRGLLGNQGNGCYRSSFESKNALQGYHSQRKETFPGYSYLGKHERKSEGHYPLHSRDSLLTKDLLHQQQQTYNQQKQIIQAIQEIVGFLNGIRNGSFQEIKQSKGFGVGPVEVVGRSGIEEPTGGGVEPIGASSNWWTEPSTASGRIITAPGGEARVAETSTASGSVRIEKPIPISGDTHPVWRAEAVRADTIYRDPKNDGSRTYNTYVVDPSRPTPEMLERVQSSYDALKKDYDTYKENYDKQENGNLMNPSRTSTTYTKEKMQYILEHLNPAKEILELVKKNLDHQQQYNSGI